MTTMSRSLHLGQTSESRLRLGSAIMALGGLGFVGYGVIFFARNFTG
jgi:hypothetical protein